VKRNRRSAGPRRAPLLGCAILSLAVARPAAAAPSLVAIPAQPVLSFAPAAVGVTAATAQTLSASFTVTGYTGTFTPTASLRYGLHYSAGPVQCTAVDAGGETCTVAVTFTPGLPGGRKDAVRLTSGSTIIGTMLLYGVGQGALGLIQPGIVTQPISGYANYLYQSAVDESGTVYIAGSNSSSVIRMTSAGVVTALPITVTAPQSVAVDGAGTLYVAENTYSKSVVTYDATGVQGALTMTPPSPYVPCSNSNGGALEYLSSVAVDGLGDVFATETLCNQIFELTAGGPYVTTAIAPAITQPATLTVDSAGDVFVGGYTINEIAAGGAQSQVNAVGAGDGLAVDAAGTLYATRYTGGGVAMLAAASYGSAFASLDPSASPLGASVGPDGTLYVGNYTNLDRVDRSQGAIAFGEQTVGATSAAQNVTLYNGGNAPLDLSAINVTGQGFAAQAAATSGCTTSTVLAPGDFCQVAVTFTAPHAGTFSGTLSLASNSLNAATTQLVALSGFAYGVYVTASPDPLSFGAQPLDAGTATLPVTLTNGGDLYAAILGTPSVDGGPFGASIGTCSAELAVDASCQLQLSFAPDAAQAYSGTVTLSAASTGGGPSQTVTFAVEGTGGAGPAAGADASPDAGAADASADALDAAVGAPSVDATASDATIAPDATTQSDAGVPVPDAAAVADASPSASPDAGEDTAMVATGEDAPGASYDASFSYDAPSGPSPSGSGGWNCDAVGAGPRPRGSLAPLIGLAALVVLRRRRNRG
jgi:MYXO-CTERM domain-containing protein